MGESETLRRKGGQWYGGTSTVPSSHNDDSSNSAPYWPNQILATSTGSRDLRLVSNHCPPSRH